MLKSSIGSIDLDCCVYNASGPRSGTFEALSKVGGSRAGAILSKSCTLVKQNGNELPRAISGLNLGPDVGEGSFNSEGLPNAGIDYYISSENREALAEFNKPYILSLSGKSIADNCEMLGRALEAGIDAVELNLACPNVPGKPIIAYDFLSMKEACKRATDIISKYNSSGRAPRPFTFGVKLAPYFDRPHFQEAVRIVTSFPIQFITTCNTIGNALFVDTNAECASITGNGGFGGLAGGYIKPTALANIRIISELLEAEGRQDVKVVGVGGIASGEDAFEAILCGASAVQIGSCHWTEGAKCFDRIAAELEDLMKSKGYSSIADFRGKLKPYQPHKAKATLTKKRGAVATGSGSSEAEEPLILGIATMNSLVLVFSLLVGYFLADYLGYLPTFVPPPTYSGFNPT